MPVPNNTSALPDPTLIATAVQSPGVQPLSNVVTTVCWPFDPLVTNSAAATPVPFWFAAYKVGATGFRSTGLVTAPDGVLMVTTAGPMLALAGITALICVGPAKINGNWV